MQRFENPQQGDDKAFLLQEFLDLFVETYQEWYPLRYLPHKSVWKSDSHTSLTEVELESYHQDEEPICHEYGTEQIALPSKKTFGYLQSSRDRRFTLNFCDCV